MSRSDGCYVAPRRPGRKARVCLGRHIPAAPARGPAKGSIGAHEFGTNAKVKQDDQNPGRVRGAAGTSVVCLKKCRIYFVRRRREMS